ncbi:sensor histidine kinase [Paludibaculum fermentans]|uniref:Histidine kinase n=1 Tax=Paludibaculum fermentans TaxID=1473598 RepID=A0A7S7NUS5_PALFE|nr:histidine kinase [Paludibaculum fermentans]QOY90118.1 histidine kinase [Paludibaculum fermentans]
MLASMLKITENRTLRRTFGYFLAWTILGLFMFSQGIVQSRFSNDPSPWTHHLTGWMVGVYVWFLLTPGIRWLGRRFPLERRYWLRRAILHTSIAFVVALLQLATEAAILHWIGVFPMYMKTFEATFFFLLIIGFHQGILTYWSVLALQQGFAWYLRYEERKQEALRLELRSSQLERQLVQAHLGALKMQLQPHFLFNTLNAIMVLVRQEKGREAEEMLGRLSDLLRCVLDDVDTQEIPVRREMEYLQLYLSIEQVRFQDRLRVEIAVAPEVLDAAVPHMILQPIVENAIRHGIGRSSTAGRLQISACLVAGRLELRVLDDGPGLLQNAPAQSRGIGLANTRARLEQLYGTEARLIVEDAEGGGVLATMLLPCRTLAMDPGTERMETNALHGFAG